MKIRPPIVFFAWAAVVAAFAGCATPPENRGPQNSTKYTVEDAEKFAPLDELSQAEAACTGLQERTLGDGRLQVVANIKNRVPQGIVIQAQCLFWDAQGFSSGSTSWRTLILPEDSTEAVRFVSANALAARYTIRVRQPR